MCRAATGQKLQAQQLHAPQLQAQQLQGPQLQEPYIHAGRALAHALQAHPVQVQVDSSQPQMSLVKHATELQQMLSQFWSAPKTPAEVKQESVQPAFCEPPSTSNVQAQQLAPPPPPPSVQPLYTWSGGTAQLGTPKAAPTLDSG